MRNRRDNNQLRDIEIVLDFVKNPLSSVLFSQGNTKVLTTVSIVESVPPHLKNTGTGWITAEYSLLPGSTFQRKQRERFKVSGRTYEIQRFIGRSLRSITDLSLFGERTVYIDCDVLQADGGTRCAAINGSFIAFAIGVKRLLYQGSLDSFPISNKICAVSSGIVEGEFLLDLDYEEDNLASVDGNFVFSDDERIVEIQIQGEENTFSYKEFEKLFNLSREGSYYIFRKMDEVLSKYGISIGNKK